MMRVVLLCAVFMFISSCGSNDDPKTYVGYVEAEYVYVAAPQAGWLRSFPYWEGDHVNVGDILFELDKDEQEALLEEAKGRAAEAEARVRDMSTGARSEEIENLENQLEEANARFELAEAEKNRWLPLVASGDASAAKGDQVTSDYEAALAKVKTAEQAITVAKLAARSEALNAAEAAAMSAKAALERAQWVLDQRTVKAQADARIEDIFHRQGEYARAGEPVVALLPSNALKVKFFVPESRLQTIHLSDAVKVKTDGGEELEAAVSYIAREAEFTPPVIYSARSRDKLVFLIEARLAGDEALRPGLPVDVVAP